MMHFSPSSRFVLSLSSRYSTWHFSSNNLNLCTLIFTYSERISYS
jgi:hypothetical protein